MTLKAYDVHDQGAFSALVFAYSPDHAVGLAREHMASFGVHGAAQVTVIERRPALLGRAGSMLAAAINAGDAGIGYRQVDGSWLVRPSGDRDARSAPTSVTTMHCFIDDDDYEVVIFASSYQRPEAIFKAFADRYDLMPSGWRGSEWEAWNTVGLVRHLAQAEHRGVEGHRRVWRSRLAGTSRGLCGFGNHPRQLMIPAGRIEMRFNRAPHLASALHGALSQIAFFCGVATAALRRAWLKKVVESCRDLALLCQPCTTLPLHRLPP